MKHLIIIGIGLVALIALLNREHIGRYLHRAEARPGVVQTAARAEPAPVTLPAPQSSNSLVNLPLLGTTNAAAASVPTTNWSSTAAQRYADIIKNIRSTRGN
ncbi:MAG TPA: hypothetical protein VG167_09465 [Verrucomicrobiae bacterium]|nr:hypothetical protein [Verrucomicrobiae bacterium]